MGLAAALAMCLGPPASGVPQSDTESASGSPSGNEKLTRFLELDKVVGALFFAVEVGDEARALQWIASGADLKAKFGGESLMDAVVRRGRPAVFDALIEAGVPAVLSSGKRVSRSDLLLPGESDPKLSKEAPDADKESPPKASLQEAAARGLDGQVAKMLAAGADVNAAGLTGLTALHWAAAGGRGSTVHLLIESGAKLNLRGGTLGRTPLEMALAIRGNDSSIAALRAAGVELVHDQADARGTTLLHHAAQNGYLHIMRELIASAAVTNAKSYLTPDKRKLLDTPVLSAVKRDETDAVVMLIRRGAELNVQDYLGGTPLWYAHGHHDGVTVRMLITGGSDPNLAGCAGEAPLLEALRFGKEEKARVLLEMDADPNATFKGNTGLHVVALAGAWEMATWLLDAGANPNLRNAEGQTPFELAVQVGNDMVAHVLLPRGSDALLLAIASMDLADMRQTLQLGANPTQSLSDGSTPLHQFARMRAKGFEAAKLFLAAGANPNSLDNDGNSPLSELMESNAHAPFIELLLGAGADPRMGSQPAAMLAQRMGDRNLMDMLSRRPGIPKVPILTRSGFPHPGAQASKACEGYAGLGDYDNALAQINLAVHAKPKNGRYRLYRAKLRVATGDAQGSMEDYARLLGDKPSWFDPKVDYGILLIQNGRYQEGLELLNDVMTRFVGATDAKLHYNRGRARAGVGDVAGALADLELADTTKPNSGEILRHLGLVQQTLGDLESACKSWRSAAQAGDAESAELAAVHCK
ncbi:MAG: ankyrin repeat protein [Planctomycetota bacterium]|jgi:ankyrin repeat protein